MLRNNEEIADSDGESDADGVPSLPQPQLELSLGASREAEIPDIDLGVNFSDFLSHSQNNGVNELQLSATEEDCLEAAQGSTGTTASLKRQIESEQRKLAKQGSSTSLCGFSKKTRQSNSSDSPIVAKTKRRHSELLTAGGMDGGQDAKNKRQKTYISGNRTRSSQSEILMEEYESYDARRTSNSSSGRQLSLPSDQPEMLGEIVSEAQDHLAGCQDQVEGPHLMERQLQLHHQDAVQSHFSEGPDVLKDCVQMSSGRISTTRSLMGNYESINLDFSVGGQGIDANANPFGDPSQQSAADHSELKDQENAEALFRPPLLGPFSTVPLATHASDHIDTSTNINLMGITGTEQAEVSFAQQVSAHSKSYVDPSLLTKEASDDAQDPLSFNQVSSRKRRKTADGSFVALLSEPKEPEEDQATVNTRNKTPPTVQTQPKKRGRKQKNKSVEPNDDSSHEQLQRSDDQHKPAPLNDTIHKRHPSSELLIDDESTIGLPPEQYKPRPSRSRSKRNAEGDMPPPTHTPVKVTLTSAKALQTPEGPDTAQPDEQEDTPLTKLKKEKRKMNKMKRAKTSAAALLKKSDRMLSDGEEDVVWVDTKPAVVKMKLPDPVALKKEEEAVRTKDPVANDNNARHTDTEEVDRKEMTTEEAVGKDAEIPVSPTQAEEKKQSLAPQKRGRKKKKVPEMPVATETIEEKSDEPAEAEEGWSSKHPGDANVLESKASSSRQPLEEKAANTSHITISNRADESYYSLDHTPSPSKTTTTATAHLPSESNPQIQKEGGNGPTKHSPINPSGGKVRYRVGLSKRAAVPPLLKIVRK